MAIRDPEGDSTEADESTQHPGRAGAVSVQRFLLEVVDGPNLGQDFPSTSERCSVGSHAGNDLVLGDRMVSRFHFEVRLEGQGVIAKDLGSTNGTFVDGVPVREAWLRDGSLIRVGQSTVAFHTTEQRIPLRISERESFGGLVGRSMQMKVLFAILEKAAASDSTVVLEGETGTGKSQAAEAIHEASARSEGPFVLVDCSGIPENLLESELFGHEKGAFTGAVEQRVGAFEAAHGGTLFLDEIGELPLHLQPKLLRFLESRRVRRVGSTSDREVDVRVITATNRDLREEVNRGDFRPDLYYRISVIRAELPPLRSRPEDIPPIAARLLRSLRAEPAASLPLLQPDFLAQLQRATWPGNVRQLRNHLERCLVLGAGHPGVPAPVDPGQPWVDPSLTFADARQKVLERFEREYLAAALARHQGNVSQAARGAELNRVYLHRLLRRHGLR